MSELKRILVVDDDEDIHALLEHTLEQGKHQLDVESMFEGDVDDLSLDIDLRTYEIHHTFQGVEALEKIEDANKYHYMYDLIFMDLQLPPGMDGIETIKKISETNPNLKFVICSGFNNYSWEDVQDKVGKMARLFLLEKPFNINDIKKIIAQ